MRQVAEAIKRHCGAEHHEAGHIAGICQESREDELRRIYPHFAIGLDADRGFGQNRYVSDAACPKF